MLDPRKHFSPTRALARFANAVLLTGIALVLLFWLLVQVVPTLHAYRQVAARALNATLGVSGLFFGWHDWAKWYGKAVAAAGALILVGFFVPQLPGRIYIVSASALAILVYLFAGLGRKRSQ